jgi:hypothetical protein
MVVIDTGWIVPLQVVLGIVIPALVGLVTTKLTNPAVKSLLLMFFTVLGTFGAQVADAAVAQRKFELVSTLVAAAGTYVLAICVHYGFLKPTGVSALLAALLIKDPVDRSAVQAGTEHVLAATGSDPGQMSLADHGVDAGAPKHAAE